MECSHVMVAVGSTRERAVGLSPGCVRAKETAQWTRAAEMTVKRAG